MTTTQHIFLVVHFLLDISASANLNCATMSQITVEKTIGDVVKDFRVKRNWTLEQMAGVVQMSPSGLNAIELNKIRRPHARTLHKLKQLIPQLEGL